MGLCDGITKAYFENEQLREEVLYHNGQIDGDIIQYYENGAKALLLPHENGKLHGAAFEWYPSGVLKLERHFRSGHLHGEGKSPAVVFYDEQRNISEVIDFRDGAPFGIHLRYHPNGKESYRVAYKSGKKEGQEQFFDESGSLLGSGEFIEGHPVGRHWRDYSKGKSAYIAEFDLDGNTLSSVKEYSQDGQKIRE